MASSEDAYGGGAGGYSGDVLALTDTTRYRSRPHYKNTEEGSARVHATETRSGKASTIRVSSAAVRMEAVMAKLMRVNIFAYNALCLSYMGLSYEKIGHELHCSTEYARRYKIIGFNSVVMEVDNFPTDLLI